MAIKIKKSVKESAKEEKVSLMYSPKEIRDWLYDHDQATEDCLNYFKAENLESINIEDIKDWITDHDELFADFIARFKVNESKQPRIVEYISPERKELNKRAAEIDDKWYKDITEDDIQFLKDNGLDYDTEKRSVVFADTRQKIDFPYYSRWSWDKENGNVDWIDKTAKASERNRSDEFDFGKATRLGRKNHSYRTSDELKRTSKELADAKRWGTDRQEKVWQGKHDREAAKLADKRKDAYNKEWREEQNKDMSKDYRTLSYINKNLNSSNHGYDARIEYAQKRKADREQELLQRYKDELDRYQRDIDDAKAEKEAGLKRKAQILRKPEIDNPDDNP